MSEQEKKQPRQSSLALAAIVIAIVTVTVSAATLYYKVDVHAPIAMLAFFIAAIGYFILHQDYKKMEDAAMESVALSMPSCTILCLVGMLVGLWMRGGIVPGLIYYGLNLLSPKIFPLATLLICSIVSLATGSSWSTEATVGVAMMGIGHGLGINPAFTAGVVVSGAYFGDKMSPLSDTTNLAPAVSGSKLFDHIGAMLWTTGPAYVIFVVILIFFGFKFAGTSLDSSRIAAIQAIIKAEFPISVLCVVPPLLVIVASIFKIPAMPGIVIGILAGMVMCAMNGSNLGEMWNLSQWGYKAQLSAEIAALTDPAQITALLTTHGLSGLAPDQALEAAKTISRLVGRGGIQNMMWSVSLAILAMAMGGLLEVTGMLSAFLEVLTKSIRRAGGLIAATVASCFVANLLAGSQYLSIIIPGRMMKTKFEQSGLAPRMLSRALEDCGTVTSVMIPWNVCGGYAAGVLGVSTMSYVPYAMLNWMTPIISIIITYLGIGIFWHQKDGTDKIEHRTLLNTPEQAAEAPASK